MLRLGLACLIDKVAGGFFLRRDRSLRVTLAKCYLFLAWLIRALLRPNFDQVASRLVRINWCPRGLTLNLVRVY